MRPGPGAEQRQGAERTTLDVGQGRRTEKSTDHPLWLRPESRRRGRRRAHRGCSGYLQSDGYQAYEGVSERAGLLHVGFRSCEETVFEALKALPNAQRKQASTAHEAVRRIDALYLIERQIKDLSDEERTRIRSAEAVPQLASLREWAGRMQHETMPSGNSARHSDI